MGWQSTANCLARVASVHVPAQPVSVREGVDLDVVVVAVAVGRVPPQVRRQLPRRVAVVQVRLRRAPVHHWVQACAGTACDFMLVNPIIRCIRVARGACMVVLIPTSVTMS